MRAVPISASCCSKVILLINGNNHFHFSKEMFSFEQSRADSCPRLSSPARYANESGRLLHGKDVVRLRSLVSIHSGDSIQSIAVTGNHWPRLYTRDKESRFILVLRFQLTFQLKRESVIQLLPPFFSSFKINTKKW